MSPALPVRVRWATLFVALQGCAAGPHAQADTQVPENQHEIRCGGSGCFHEATQICFERHQTTRYNVLGQRPAGGGLIIQCDLPEPDPDMVRPVEAS